MDSLVITPTEPPTHGLNAMGIYKRLGMFIEAIGSGDKPLNILHLVPEDTLSVWADRAHLNQQQSIYWNREVRVTLAPRRVRLEGFFNHYIAGAIDSSNQPPFYPYGGPAIEKAITAQLERNPAVIFVHRLAAMQALLNTRRRLRNMFFDLDDIEHWVRLRHSIQPPIWPGKLAYVAHVPALFRAERTSIIMSRQSFICSERDRRYLGKFGLRDKLTVIPNAVPMPASIPPLATEKTILFIGGLSYQPNAEAVERLVKAIMPLIWQHMPEARLMIAGEGGNKNPECQSDQNRVDYLGFVPDLDKLYARSRIVCCPISNGGGTRVKLIEAAAYAKPMVATRIGAEGLAFVDGEDILLRDKDIDLAQACIQLLKDDQLCRKMGLSAHNKMSQLYEKSEIIHKIKQTIYCSAK